MGNMSNDSTAADNHTKYTFLTTTKMQKCMQHLHQSAKVKHTHTCTIQIPYYYANRRLLGLSCNWRKQRSVEVDNALHKALTPTLQENKAFVVDKHSLPRNFF